MNRPWHPLTFKTRAVAFSGWFFDLPPEEVHFGHRPSIGTCHITVNEFGEANITTGRIAEGCRTLNLIPVMEKELIRLGIKACVWTKTTGGRKRIVRRIFPENCTADEIRRFQAVIDMERAIGLNIIKDPEDV